MTRFQTAFTLLVFSLTLACILHARCSPPDPAFGSYGSPEEIELPALVEVRHPYALAGRIVDPRGAPVADALVELVALERVSWDYTGVDGTFVLAGLPEGDFEALVSVEHYPPSTHPTRIPEPAPVRWVLSPPRAELAVLPPLLRAPLRGEVRARDDTPVEGCQVVVEPAAKSDPLSGAMRRRATVDADGSFEIEELAHGRYELRVLPPLVLAGADPGLALATLDFVHAGPRDVELELTCASVHGRLSDPRGRPIAGAQVLASREGDERLYWQTQSDAKTGEFHLRHLPAGQWTVRIRAGEADEQHVVHLAPCERYALVLDALDPNPPQE